MAEEKEDGSKPAKDILAKTREELNECIAEEASERAKMKDDLRFMALDQWPQDVRQEREGDVENGPRPCLTIDKINQYRNQVVNDLRQGKPGINVRPQDDAADVQTAKILKGLVRNIEDQSSADIAYATAVENAAKIGLGYFRITTEYVSDDSFDQEIFIRSIPNTFSVYLGKHLMPDGSDAERGYIVEQIPKDKFKAMFPDAKTEVKEFENLDLETRSFWQTDDTVTVVEEFCIKRSLQEIHFLVDGRTISAEDFKAAGGDDSLIQESRLTTKKQLKWRKMTAVEVLEKRDLPGQYVPIVEVVGREAWVDGKRVLWGLVRPAKDSLRMYNYFASTITERMALAPKVPFVGAKGQFENLEERWKNANRVNYAYLEYNPIDVNGNAIPAPQRVGPTPIEAALLQQMQVIEHDVQTSLGMFKAAVGETESQQSGRAILALQRESDTGTYHFGANLGVSIRHAGRIIVDLIPHYYDTKRIVRILGEDGEVQTAQLDPSQPQAMVQMQGNDGAMRRIYNPSVGKYDVSITVGPSYNTKRMEASATFVELAKGAADPISANLLRYLTVLNSDFNGSEQGARALKALLPPPVVQALGGDGQQQIPPVAQAQIMQLTQVAQQLKQENEELQSGAREAQAKIMVSREEGQQKLQLQSAETSAKLQAEREAAAQKLALERAVAEEKAKLAREIALAEAQLKREVAAADHEIACADHALNMKKVEFEREQKIASDPQFKASSEMPKVAEGMGQVAQGLVAIGEAVKQLAQINAAILDTSKDALAFQKKPKEVGIGNVRMSGDGNITGARVTVQ